MPILPGVGGEYFSWSFVGNAPLARQLCVCVQNALKNGVKYTVKRTFAYVGFFYLICL